MASHFKNVGIIAKRSSKEVLQVTQVLTSILESYDCKVYFSEDTKMSQPIDLLIVLGGDGMMLKGARLVAGTQIPLLGIKMGSLGFLIEVLREEASTALHHILKNQYVLEPRMKLEATILRKGEEAARFTVLNDVVIHTTGLARISNYGIYMNDQSFLNMRADGLILATPTGATAYSLAAGGPMVDPKLESVLFTPICSQNLSLRSIVFSPETRIRVEIIQHNSSVLLTLDGQEEFQLQEGDILDIQKSVDQCYFILPKHSNYLESLKKKLWL